MEIATPSRGANLATCATDSAMKDEARPEIIMNGRRLRKSKR